MNFTAKKRHVPGSFFKAGDHLVVIAACSMDQSRQVPEWADRTPEVKIEYRNANGVIFHNYALKGFKKLDKDENPKGIAPAGFEYRQASDKEGNPVGPHYLVDVKSNTRVEDEASTAMAQDIFGGVAADAGIADGEDFTLNDLVGASIGICVRERAENGKPEVRYTMEATNARVAELVG